MWASAEDIDDTLPQPPPWYSSGRHVRRTMPEGHTSHRLAHEINSACAAAPVGVSRPQRRFAAAAELLNGRELLGAKACGKLLLAECHGERSLIVHLGLIGYFSDIPREEGEEIWGQVRLRIEIPGW